MGIFGLEKFIRNSEHGISQTIDIRDEIAKWRREHDNDPIIVCDLKEMSKILVRFDANGTTLGGQYNRVNELLDYFFGEIKKCKAKLVFDVRLSDGRFKDIDELKNPYETYDSIEQYGISHIHWRYLNDLLVSSGKIRPNERMWYNLLSICKNYGEMIASYALHKRAILSFVREHQDDVMAIITRNTEYFVYDLNFQYWSLSDIELNTLKIAKFCRQTLNEVHGLSYQQMQLMLAIFRVANHGYYVKFLDKVEYIKKLKINANGYELDESFDNETRRQINKKISEVKDTASFTGDWNDDIYSDFLAEMVKKDDEFRTVLRFFKEKIHFAYKLINEEQSGPHDLLFIDVRRTDSRRFIDLALNTTLKLIGIVFKDFDREKCPKTRTMQIKHYINRPAEQVELDIIYPTMALPSLKDLIVQEDDMTFNLERRMLLQWLLGVNEDEISEIRTSAGSKFIRVASLTVKFLLLHQIISTVEADAILRAENQHESKNNVYVPRSQRRPPPMPKTRYPAYVDINWIQTAHKYTIAFELVCHCLELCGLRQETALIRFEAFDFHENMQEIVMQNARNHPQDLARRTQRIHL